MEGYFVAQDGVGGDEQFSCDCDQRDLGGFSGGSQTQIHGPEAVMRSGGRDGGHVEGVADPFSAAFDSAQAPELTAVDVEGGEPGDGRNLLGLQTTEFRHEGDQRGGGDGSYTGNGAEQPGGLIELLGLSEQTADLLIPLRNPRIEPFQMRLNVHKDRGCGHSERLVRSC